MGAGRSGWSSRVAFASGAALLALLWPASEWTRTYAAALAVLSVWLSCRRIRLLLRKEEKYEEGAVGKDAPGGRWEGRALASSLVERKCVWPWYSRYISKEVAFPFACRELADRCIARFAQVSAEVCIVDAVCDAAKVLLRHRKEYGKASRRARTRGGAGWSDRFKYSHPALGRAKGERSRVRSHCGRAIRAVAEDLLPWELRDGPHSDLLVAVLGERLAALLEDRLADPRRLRSAAKAIVAAEAETPKEEAPVPPKSRAVPEPPATRRPPPEPTPIAKSVQASPIRSVQASPIRSVPAASAPVAISAVKSRPAEPVKIYDKIIVEDDIKTWSDDADLGCASLGRDPLASLDDEDEGRGRIGASLGRLWSTEDDDVSAHVSLPSDQNDDLSDRISRHGLWFGEEDNPDIMEQLHRQPKNMDEAAGMMEGIFDFGIAGLKKGLSLAGLHEIDKEDAAGEYSRSNQKSPKVIVSNNKASSNGIQNNPSLMKQQHIQSMSQEDCSIPEINAAYQLPLNADFTIPTVVIAEDHSQHSNIDGDSPDYEYEETKDLPSCIEKLRCLLQQKTGDISPIMQEETDAWPKKSDLLVEKSPDDDLVILSSEGLAELYESEENRRLADNNPEKINMQRLDRLFTRTVTGVFNTIKTAVGADSASEADETQPFGQIEPQAVPISRQANSWIFVPDDIDTVAPIGRLLAERRSYCVVETGCDTLDMLNGIGSIEQTKEEDSKMAVDELDELESTTKYPLWQMCIELVSASLEDEGCAARKDVVIKACNNLMKDYMEGVLQEKLETLCGWCKTKSFDVLQSLHRDVQNSCDDSPTVEKEVDDVSIDELCDAIIGHIPNYITVIFGDEEIRDGIKSLLESVSCQNVNRDLVLNLLDVAVHHFLKTSKLHSGTTMTPPPSA